MLPSSGYFKNVACPYFKSGLCQRPNCHFNHARTELSGRCSSSRNAFEENELINSDSRAEILQLMNLADQRAHNDLKRSEIALNVEIDPRTYIPTPVEKGKTSSILKSNKSAKYAFSSIPEYKPTPISELKRISNSDGDVIPDSAFNHSTNIKKKRKVEEYDPAEVKCVPKKRVSFMLPENRIVDYGDDIVEIDPVPVPVPVPSTITILDSSDEDDMEETEFIPQFSDDDDDDEMHNNTSSCNAESEEFKSVPNNANKNGHSLHTEEIKEEIPLSTSKFSLVDKILVDVKRNEELIKEFKKPVTKPLHMHFDHKPEVRESHDVKMKNIDNVPKKKTTPCEKKCLKPKEEIINISENTTKPAKIVNKSNLIDSSDGDNIKSPLSKSKNNICPPKDKKGSSNYNGAKSNSVTSKKEIKSKSEKSKVDEKGSKVKLSNSKNDKRDKEKRDSKSVTVSKASKESDAKHSIKKNSETSSSKKRRLSSGDKQESGKVQNEKSSDNCHSSKKHPTLSKSVKNSSSENKTSKSSNQDDLSKNCVKSSSRSLNKTLSETNSKNSKIKVSTKKKDAEILATQQSKHNTHIEMPNSEECSSDSDLDDQFLGPDSEVDSDTAEECLRIFNETPAKPVSFENCSVEVLEERNDKQKDEAIVVGKKRIAHQLSMTKVDVPKVQKRILNPAQVMLKRFSKVEEMYTRQNSTEEKKVFSAFANSCKNSETNRKRIANVPNPELVAAVTKRQKCLQKSSSSANVTQEESNGDRPVISIPKRVAHVPITVTKSRPVLPVEYGCKVPINIRQRYLNNFIDECLKFCLTEDEAYETALEEEKTAYDHSTSKNVYLNVAIHVLKRLRIKAEEGPRPACELQMKAPSLPTKPAAPVVKEKPVNKTISHEAMLFGAKAQRFSFSIEKKKPRVEPEITAKELYQFLSSYILTPEQLVENGFPQPHPTEAGRAVISGIYNKKQASTDPFKRVCTRCQKFYTVDAKFNYTKIEDCDYHWGRLFKKRIAGAIESRYFCCDGDSQSKGCCVGSGHVYDGDTQNHTGYVKTLPKTPPLDGYFGVYSLDCEMCYTTAGIELIRVTVIKPDLKSVYETYVKPKHKILDYNTRFSGITEEHLQGVKTSITDVQAILLSLFSDRTILIGHSLDSDFKALKLIHNTVVDTSVVFPHKRGLPFKRALRTLMAEKLQKIIQNSLDGHDSNEDAVACMELMLWKIKEDSKYSNR